MASTYLEKEMDAEMKELEDDDDMEESDDENDSGSDEDLEGEEEDPELLKNIALYEEDISSNPYNYSAHYELVTALRKTEDFEKLREARKRFHKFYPLTSDLWLDWISDEQKIATSEEEKKMVDDLFEKGVKDYLSVDLWLEYCQHSIGGIGTKEGIVRAREIHEKAIIACGLHISKGALIWEAYREFESALLSMMTPTGSEELEKIYADQKKKVENLYKRQLRQPLLGMEDTFNEYKEFTKDATDGNVVSDYHKAKEKLKARQKFEKKLIGEEIPIENYQEYIDFEMKEKDPTRIQIIFERSITDHCLVSTLWSQYLTYLDSNLKISTVSLPVFERSIRNVPWSVEIWCDYLRSLERYEQPHSEVLSLFEQGLAAGFAQPAAYLELWLCFIDYLRRRTVWNKDITESMSALRTVFERANLHLAKCGGDPDFEVSKYCANLEADQFGVMENARKIWAEITAAHPFTASVWLEYIQLEKTFGDKKHLRKAYQRGLEKTHDDPEILVRSFTQFEREEGSLEAFEHCRKLCRIKMEKVGASKSKGDAKKSEEEQSRHDKIEKKKEKDKDYRRDKRQQIAAEKRGDVQNTQNGKDNVFLKPSVPVSQQDNRSWYDTPELPEKGSKKVVAPPPGFPGKKSVAPPPGFNENMKRTIAPPPGFKEPLPKKQKSDDFDNLSEHQQRKLRTVFLSNLDFSVTDTEVNDIMRSSGVVLEVRLVKKPNGQSKGFAFVEFEKHSEALEAMKRDNELLGLRPMYISECDPEKKAPVFKFDKGLEKNKLFIKGLDPEVTKQDLTEVFEKFGKLIDVRLVTYRNGHSKGLAFVDYEEEVGAATALIKTDNMKIKSKEIQVALSNPPKRKDDAPNQSDVRSLGGTEATEFGPRGKGRSQVAFTPRSISVPAKPPSKLEPMKFVKPGVPGLQSEGNEGNGTKPSKSNEDFRKMLLK
eukprot:GFUD01024863.1.p1 GENE.GFUD01024863.1~~GFUD01024863.1.p1  ORF type:complete len:939 (+),score=286.08 GFUD01024863.1:83-2899(+)